MTAALFLFAAVPAQAEEGDTGESIRHAQNVAADILFARPFGFVQLVASVAMLPLAWPAGYVVGDSDFGPRVCWRWPADRLFRKPLGEL